MPFRNTKKMHGPGKFVRNVILSLCFFSFAGHSSQNDFSIANQSGASFRTDVNSAFQALASNSSGSSAPSTTYAFQFWIDTSPTPNLLKMRNGANSAWITVGDATATNLGLLALAGGTMTGALFSSVGTAGAPGVAFAGDTDTGMFHPSSNIVALAAAGASMLEVTSGGVILNGTGSLTLPAGTLAQRPGTPSVGMFRYNSDTPGFEGYINGSWKAIATLPLGTSDISDSAITSIKIASSAVTSAKIATGAVGSSQLADSIKAKIPRSYVNFNGVSDTGTYSRTGLTITVTMASHGMTTGMNALLDFTSGTGVDGIYPVTVTGANTYTITDGNSGSTSGNVTQKLYIRAESSLYMSGVQRLGTGHFSFEFTNDPDINSLVFVQAVTSAGLPRIGGGWMTASRIVELITYNTSFTATDYPFSYAMLISATGN